MSDAGSQDPYIYADNAATTPLSPRALEAMTPYLTESFGNPGGIHRIARDAACALEDARARTAELLGAHAHELYLTSGGTESDNWILQGAVRRHRDLHGTSRPVRVITSAVEHHAVLHGCRRLREMGADAVMLPVDGSGRVDPASLSGALDDADREGADVALVSIMLANNEVGTIEDIPVLARISHERGIPFHTDAVQAVGHIPVDVDELGVDALSLSAHKFHGPRGTGALYLRDGFSIPPMVEGGGQERGLRSGTQDVASAVGMAAALEEACEDLEGRARRVGALRDRLVSTVLERTPGVRPTGEPDPHRRLPSIASFICHDVDGELLVVLLDRAGVAAATGSACSTGSTEPSHVITAMGWDDPSWNRGTLRLSLADDVTDRDIDLLCERVPRCIERARLLSGFSR